MARKIMIIEDYPATSEMIASLMQMEGFETSIAADGATGVKKTIPTSSCSTSCCRRWTALRSAKN